MKDKFAFDEATGRMAFTAVGCMDRHSHSRESEFKPDFWNKVAGVREVYEERQLLARVKELQVQGKQIGSMSPEEFVAIHADGNGGGHE
jgi:hypothetical protein